MLTTTWHIKCIEIFSLSSPTVDYEHEIYIVEWFLQVDEKVCMCRRSRSRAGELSSEKEIKNFSFLCKNCKNKKCLWITISLTLCERARLYSQTSHRANSVFFFRKKKGNLLCTSKHSMKCIVCTFRLSLGCIIFTRTRHNICFFHSIRELRFVVCHFSPLNELFIFRIFIQTLSSMHSTQHQQKKGFWCATRRRWRQKTWKF